MSEPQAESKPAPRRSRLFLAILLVLLVGGGGALFVVYKKIWDADQPTDPVPGMVFGPAKGEDGQPGKPGLGGFADAESKKANDTIEDFFTALNTAISYARDSMRIGVSLTTLKDLSSQVDGFRAMIDKLPAAGKAKVLAGFRDQLKQAKETAALGLGMPGSGDQLKPLVEPLMVKLDALAK